MTDIVIVAALRTAIGKFGGTLAKNPAPDLGATVIRALLARSGVEARAGFRGDPGPGAHRRQRPEPCATGVDSRGIAACRSRDDDQQGLRIGTEGGHARGAGNTLRRRRIVVAGGQENMSASPHVLPGSRDGFRMGDAKLVDTMIVDGLWDVYNQYHMGATAENVAKKYGVSRARAGRVRGRKPEQGGSGAKGRALQRRDRAREMPQRKGDPVAFATDEFLKPGTTPESLAGLRPAFAKDGTVTAANASGLNDGAAAVLVMSAEGAASSASSRSRASRRTRRPASIRRSWAWDRCRHRAAASRRPDGRAQDST